LIIRSEKGVTAESLANIYKALGQVIKDETCFFTKDELEDLKNRDFIKLGGAKNG
jgi:hypothetical protein